MGSEVKEERRSLVPRSEEGVDSPLKTLADTCRALAAIHVSSVEVGDKKATQAKIQALEKYRTDVRGLLAPLASERVPQQPQDFESLEINQNQLLESLKTKEGKKFENRVLEKLHQHAAYEHHLQLSLAEVISILEDVFLDIIRNDRETNEQELKTLKEAYEKKGKEYDTLKANVFENNQVVEELSRNADESGKRDREIIKRLRGEIQIINKLKEQFDEKSVELEALKAVHLAEKEGHRAILKATKKEKEEIQSKIEALSKTLAEARRKNANLQIERDEAVTLKEVYASEKDEIEKQLLQAKRDLEAAFASAPGFLNNSVGSEDYSRPLYTPRVRFSRRLSLSSEMNADATANGLETHGVNNDSVASPIQMTNAPSTPSRSNEPTTGQSAFLKQLGELVSREDRKNIPIFKGDGDPFVVDWLRDAERIARSNEWDDSQRIKFFSDRLRGEACEWHFEFLDRNPGHFDYRDWKEELRTRFTDEADVERLRTKLNSLKQRPEQRVKAFIGMHDDVVTHVRSCACARACARKCMCACASESYRSR